jgi:hypothetical protein
LAEALVLLANTAAACNSILSFSSANQLLIIDWADRTCATTSFSLATCFSADSKHPDLISLLVS